MDAELTSEASAGADTTILVWHAVAPVGIQKRVLVVDDDASIRELLSTALEEDGYEVVPAVNGQDALAVCERWRPDVIVLDLMMPVMDGWTFAKRLRERDERREHRERHGRAEAVVTRPPVERENELERGQRCPVRELDRGDAPDEERERGMPRQRSLGFGVYR